jgi:hypothetical protein
LGNCRTEQHSVRPEVERAIRHGNEAAAGIVVLARRRSTAQMGISARRSVPNDCELTR